MSQQIKNLLANQPLNELLAAIAAEISTNAETFQSKLDEGDASDMDLFEQADFNLDIANELADLARRAEKLFPVETTPEIPEGSERYLVPVVYQMTGDVAIIAETPAEALEKALHVSTADVIEPEYLSDSWEVCEQEFEDNFPEFFEDA